MTKKQVWFTTDLAYFKTRDKLCKSSAICGDMQDWKGRFTFWFKAMKDFTCQITSKQNKLSISYPENSEYDTALEQLKPYLVKADGTQAKIIAKKEYEYGKSVHEDQYERELALRHSKHLLFTNEKKSTLCADQRLDYYSPYMKLELLVSEERIDQSDVYVLLHFRTGYPELMAEAKAYIELSSKPEKNEKEQKELGDIQDLLVGKIDLILNRVSNGTPLLGVCDCCPKTTIRD